MDKLPPAIGAHLEAIRELCARNAVTRLALLGESAPRFGGDVPDFVVEFEPNGDPLVRGRRYEHLWRGLLEILGSDLNLIVESTIENPWRQHPLEFAHHDLYAAQ